MATKKVERMNDKSRGMSVAAKKTNPRDATMRNVRAANKKFEIIMALLVDHARRLRALEKKNGIKLSSSRMPKEVRDLLGGDTVNPDV